MNIKNTNATITDMQELSPTAREFVLSLSDDLPFMPGAFVNVFADIEGTRVRRAYSLSSLPNDDRTVTISVRRMKDGVMSAFLWQDDAIGKKLGIQGPLGLNTADKIVHDKIFLFGFGIGVSVIKPLAEYFANDHTKGVVIVVAHRSEDEMIYDEAFDALVSRHPNVSLRTVLSRPSEPQRHERKGYLYDHLDGYDFNDASIYLCGQESACRETVKRIEALEPKNAQFLVEGFH